MSQQILKRVASILEDQMGINPKKVTMDTRLFNDLGCDVLDLVEIDMAIELEFKLDSFEASGVSMHAVGDIVEYLEGKL